MIRISEFWDDDEEEEDKHPPLTDAMLAEAEARLGMTLPAEYGHTWISLDYREGPVPSVLWIDVECNEEIQIAPSFAAFLDLLVSIV